MRPPGVLGIVAVLLYPLLLALLCEPLRWMVSGLPTGSNSTSALRTISLVSLGMLFSLLLQPVLLRPVLLRLVRLLPVLLYGHRNNSSRQRTRACPTAKACPHATGSNTAQEAASVTRPRGGHTQSTD